MLNRIKIIIIITNAPVPTGPEEGRWHFFLSIQGNFADDRPGSCHQVHEEAILVYLKREETTVDPGSKSSKPSREYNQADIGTIR